MKKWLPAPGSLQRPAYRSLVQVIETAIDAGDLKPGDMLPTHRKLAFDLGLSVQTVSRAYERLTASGRIHGKVGRGTFVRGSNDDMHLPFVNHKMAGRLIDLSILKPVTGPEHREAFRKTLREIARATPDAVLEAFRAGTLHEQDRGAVEHWLSLCGVPSLSGPVVLTNGGTSAMTVALLTAAATGDLVACEEIGHHTLRPLSRYLGLRLKGLPTDGDGLIPEAFDEACREEPIKVLQLMPTGLSPLGFTMPHDRRAAIVEIARKHDVLIVENHSSGPLDATAPPPLLTMAPERVLFFTSLTKPVLPGLRVGFLVVPQQLGAAAANRHLVTSWMATSLTMEIAARWITDGTAEMLVKQQRETLEARRQQATTVLSGLPFRISPSGLHAWLACADIGEEEALVSAARDGGVAVARGASFAIGPHSRHPGVRISLGGLDFREVSYGLRVVGELARTRPEGALQPL